MKRVLIVSYYWPPVGGPGVQRWVKFCKYLPQYGWMPVVYTPENPELAVRDESLAAEVPAGVEVLRTHIFEPYEIYRRLTGGGKKSQSEVTPISSGRKGPGKKFVMWVRGNLFIPDPRVSWVRPSVKFLEKYLKEHPVDAVITSGPPQSMHLIGRDLKRRTGVKWVADFRDPWTQMFYYKHLGLWPLADRIHHRMEKSVLDEADVVISVSPMVRRDFRSLTSTPVELVTNGFDETDFESAPLIRHEGRFVVAHTGQLAADGNPVALWKALGSICDSDSDFARALELRLPGQVDAAVLKSIEECGLGTNLTVPGYVPHGRTVSEQKSADILILPLRREPEGKAVVPGKTFEYLASGRPVLGIGDEDGACAQILEETGAGRMFGWDRSGAMEEFVRKIWQATKAGGQTAPAAACTRYSRRELSAALAGILDKL